MDFDIRQGSNSRIEDSDVVYLDKSTNTCIIFV